MSQQLLWALSVGDALAVAWCVRTLAVHVLDRTAERREADRAAALPPLELPASFVLVPAAWRPNTQPPRLRSVS